MQGRRMAGWLGILAHRDSGAVTGQTPRAVFDGQPLRPRRDAQPAARTAKVRALSGIGASLRNLVGDGRALSPGPHLALALVLVGDLITDRLERHKPRERILVVAAGGGLISEAQRGGDRCLVPVAGSVRVTVAGGRHCLSLERREGNAANPHVPVRGLLPGVRAGVQV